MAIVIPEQLKSKLPEGSYVFTLCANAEKLFGLDAVYFAEYTKHNAEHVNAVLEFIEKLIPPHSLEKLESETVETLIAAAVFHDIGMFIQRDGLRVLLFGAYANQKTGHLDKQTWHEAWVDYYTQVRRWGDRKLIEVFGDSLPVEHGLRDKLPDEMTDRHKLLYGEFLRRYHQRLAHDIALHGFFGNEQINVFKTATATASPKN